MLVLTRDEKDAIVESFNIGVGSAAAALSEMLGREVQLSIPDLQLRTRTDLLDELRAQRPQPASGVRERFAGECSGSALLLFPEHRSLELVRLLLRQDMALDFLTEMEQEALVEVGNIILNACLSTLADMMGIEIVNHLPTAISGSFVEILATNGATDANDLVMYINMDFSITEVDIDGQMIFMLDFLSLDNLRRRLGEFFGVGKG